MNITDIQRMIEMFSKIVTVGTPRSSRDRCLPRHIEQSGCSQSLIRETIHLIADWPKCPAELASFAKSRGLEVSCVCLLNAELRVELADFLIVELIKMLGYYDE